MSDESALVAVNNEIATIAETMRTDPAAYRRDEAMQTRYRHLLSARESGKLAVLPVAAREGELVQLRALMGDSNSAYWKGPDAARNQARYLALLNTGGLLPGLDYSANPNAPPAAVEAAANVMRSLSPSDQASLIEAFDSALPEAAQQAVIAELAAGPPRAAPAASAADLALFESLPENAALARAWGGRAAVRLGILRTRLLRIYSGLSASDRRQAQHWLDSAPPKEYAAIVRQLAGG